MNYRKMANSLAFAFGAQGCNLLLKAVMVLVTPKVLGVNDYAYWQLFLFYASYEGMGHLGLNDGVYLLYGGEDRSTISSSKVAAQFWIGVIYQTIISILVLFVATLFVDDFSRRFVIYTAAIYLPIINAISYFGYVYQAINETKLFSFTTIVQNTAFMLPLIGLMIAKVENFRLYIIWYLISGIIALLWCTSKGKEFLNPCGVPFKEAMSLTRNSVKVGLPLTLANVISILIMGLARFMVDFGWGVEAFGMLSIPFYMMSVFTTFITQAGMVLFPNLRQGSDKERIRVFRILSDFLHLFMPIILVMAFPVALFVNFWLPQYSAAIPFFVLLLPICLFESSMDMTCTTYIKVLRKEKLLFSINIATLIISLAISIVGLLFRNVYIIVSGTTIAIAFRSIIAEGFIMRDLGVEQKSLSWGEILISILFVLSWIFVNEVLTFIVYIILYVVFMTLCRARLKEVVFQIGRAIHAK